MYIHFYQVWKCTTRILFFSVLFVFFSPAVNRAVFSRQKWLDLTVAGLYVFVLLYGNGLLKSVENVAEDNKNCH